MNVGGFLVVLLGSIIMIIGIRGTQSNVFPWFFGTKGKPISNNPSGGGASSAT